MKKILVVDDDCWKWIKEDILEIIGFNKDNGYEIDVASSGFSALELIREKKNKHLFITMDGHLRDMSGPLVVSEIRNFDKTVPIIMLSGDDTMNKKGIEKGANAFMSKRNFTDDAIKGGKKFKKILRKIGVKI